jgi:membrane protein YdbS with pleckstrin-like domain
MLTGQEEKYLEYWQNNREREKKLLRQLFIGLPAGLLIAAGIILSLDLDWYERANMVANASLNPYILLIAVVGIIIFMAIFYKKHQWDMKEQRYRELLFKKEKEKNIHPDNATK